MNYRPALENNMKRIAVLLFVFLLGASSLVSAGSVPTAKPEEVGLSSERLQRIHALIQRYMDGGNFTGAVTLVARRGRIAHFEANGLMDLALKRRYSKTPSSASCR